jgi:hypothetical protein
MLLKKLLLLALAVAGAAPSLSARPWRKLVTPRFTVMSEVSDGLTHDVATDFGDYLTMLQRVLPLKSGRLRPLTIILFDRDRELDDYKPVTKRGQLVDRTEQGWDFTIGAVASKGYPWTVIAVSTENYRGQLRQLMFEAGAKWYLDGVSFPLPYAVRAGIAEVLGSYHRELNHGLVGLPVFSYAAIERRYAPLPVAKLLQVTDEAEVTESGNLIMFTAESWAFAHYLLFAKSSVQDNAFNKFWVALRERVPVSEALTRAVGSERAARIDLEIRDYLHGTQYVGQIATGDKVENRDPLVPPGPGELELALGRAAAANHAADAQRRAAEAIAAGAGPEAYALRAELVVRSDAGEPEKRAAVEEALARGAQNAFLLSLAASARLEGAPHHSPEAREAVNLAEQAANSDLNFEDAFDTAAQALAYADHVTPADKQFMDYGRVRFPDDRFILLGESELARRRGEGEAADRMQALALSDSPALNARQRAAAAAWVRALGPGRAAQPGS